MAWERPPGSPMPGFAPDSLLQAVWRNSAVYFTKLRVCRFSTFGPGTDLISLLVLFLLFLLELSPLQKLKTPSFQIAISHRKVLPPGECSHSICQAQAHSPVLFLIRTALVLVMYVNVSVLKHCGVRCQRCEATDGRLLLADFLRLPVIHHRRTAHLRLRLHGY